MFATSGTREKVIAVGPPVTRRPPHRSRRAVFPHRALQPSSLPQARSGQRGGLSPLWLLNEPWPLNSEVLTNIHEALPGIAGPLAPPIEPLQAYTQRAIKEVLEARTVPVHSVVLVIPAEFALQLLKPPAEPPLAILLAPLGEALQRSLQLRARCAPLPMRFPRSVLPPAKRKPQELPAARSRRRRAAKEEDAGLLSR